jgi:hypothetical protein
MADELLQQRRRQLAEAYRRFGCGWHELNAGQHQIIQSYVSQTSPQILDKMVAEIFPELYKNNAASAQNKRAGAGMAIRESFKTAWREAFEAVFYVGCPVSLTSPRFRQMLKRRVTGQLREWHWVLPRRHPWLGPVFQKTGIDRLAMKL